MWSSKQAIALSKKHPEVFAAVGVHLMKPLPVMKDSFQN